MAGDWIKVRTSLPKDGRIRVIAKQLKKGNALGNASTVTYSVTTFGALVTLWCFADEQADEHGVIHGYNFTDINEMVGLHGFCEALPDDWIDKEGDWVKLPNYQDHNGKSAKNRAQTARRVAAHKSKKKGNADCVTSVTPTTLPREEKRREDIKIPPIPPKSGGSMSTQKGSFDRFWSAYPRKVSKGRAEKAFAKIKPDALLVDAMIDSIAQAKTSTDWKKESGQFIPHPATWLNGKCWEDELSCAGDEEQEEKAYDADWFKGAI